MYKAHLILRIRNTSKGFNWPFTVVRLGIFDCPAEEIKNQTVAEDECLTTGPSATGETFSSACEKLMDQMNQSPHWRWAYEYLRSLESGAV